MADRPRRAAQRGAACTMVLALMAAQVGEVRAANPWDSNPTCKWFSSSVAKVSLP